MASQMLGVRLTEREEEEIIKLVDAGLYVSASEFIRDSVRKNLASIRIVGSRKVPKNVAKKEIMKYLKTHEEAYASDIAENLGLDLDIVFSAMKELAKEGMVE